MNNTTIIAAPGMDLNNYGSALCGSGTSTKLINGRLELVNGLCAPNVYKENKNPSTLEVVEYESTKHDNLPEYARQMIEWIEEAEYEMLHNYMNSKDEWTRLVKIKADGSEEIVWIHKSEVVNDVIEDYEKFLVGGLAEVEKGYAVPVEYEGELVALKKMFNLSVDC
jgi:hypothetical protein